MRLKFLAALFLSVFATLPAFATEKDDAVSGRAVIREMNLARQNPALYATFVQELRSRMSGNVLVLPGHTRVRTKEGTAALDDAIRFLRNAQPLPPLAFSRGMSRAAADHCADQADGGFGHEGRDRSHAGERIARYGNFSAGRAAKISYRQFTAHAVGTHVFSYSRSA